MLAITGDAFSPPAIRTLPFGSRVAVANWGAVFMLAVPDAGAKLLTGVGAAAAIAALIVASRDRISGAARRALGRRKRPFSCSAERVSGAFWPFEKTEIRCASC